MIRPAGSADRSGITSLWREAFGDPEAAVAAFFEAFPRCMSYVAEEDGTVAAMVHGLPQTLSPGWPGVYVYAVATGAQYRNRGLCRALLAFAEADWQRRGYRCAMLTPGEPALFAFYEKLEYRTEFFRNRTAFSGGSPVDADAYLRLRERILDVPHVIYDEETLRYAQRVYGLTFYETAGGCAAAGTDYTAEVLPGDLGGSPFAMLKWLGEPEPLQEGYLGIALE